MKCRAFILLLTVRISFARGRANSNDSMILFAPEKNNEYKVFTGKSCTALVKEIESRVDRAELQCATPNGKLYNIPYVSTEFIREKQLSGELFSGETQIQIPNNTMIDTETLTLMMKNPPVLMNVIEDEFIRKRRRALRNLQKVTGKKTILVVRIQATNSVTSLSETQLADDIFGDGNDPNNLRSQYLACSYGQLEFNKAPDRSGISTNIQNGVVTISPGVATNVGDDRMIDSVLTELERQFSTLPENLAAHIVLCLPPGVMHELDVAYAWMNDFRSVYNDVVCSHVSAQMHEIGHNIGLAHSSHNGEEYGDQSGMMGYSYASDDLPHQCFNSAKSWQLGWYRDKALTVTPLADAQYEFYVKLASIVDYESTNDNVLIKVHQSTSPWAFFCNWNSAKGMNRGTQEGANKVLITAKNTDNDENVSTLLKMMGPGDSLQLENFNGKNGDILKITFLSLQNDVADLSIALSGPSVPLPSDVPSRAPTKLPTQSPSKQTVLQSPSKHTAESPSFQPSLSTKPSSVPTFMPSSKPSRLPSILPSMTPSLLPSKMPSMEPSMLPSSFPTDTPTTSPEPSTIPSAVPTNSLPPSSVPSISKIPSGQPSLSPSVSQVPSSQPSYTPSKIPSISPSSSPSYKSTELESTVPMGMARTNDLNMLDLMCKGTEAVIDKETKNTYGNLTKTKVTCSTDTSAARSRRRQLASDASDAKLMAPVIVKARTFFPREATAPDQNEYGTYLNNLVVSNKTMYAVATAIEDEAAASGETTNGIVAEIDRTVDPPALVLSVKEEVPPSSLGQHYASSSTSLFMLTISTLICFVAN